MLAAAPQPEGKLNSFRVTLGNGSLNGRRKMPIVPRLHEAYDDSRRKAMSNLARIQDKLKVNIPKGHASPKV